MQLNCFFYGTLMSSGHRGQWIQGRFAGLAEFVGPATVQGDLYDTGGFPALMPGNGVVKGELWRAKPETIGLLLEMTDSIEGYRPHDERGSMYLRREVPVLDRPGETTFTYVWNYGLAGLVPIPSGSWVECVEGKWGEDAA